MFYKLQTIQQDPIIKIIEARAIHAPTYSLTDENSELVDGWVWASSIEEAADIFGVEVPTDDEE